MQASVLYQNKEQNRLKKLAITPRSGFLIRPPLGYACLWGVRRVAYCRCRIQYLVIINRTEFLDGEMEVVLVPKSAQGQPARRGTGQSVSHPLLPSPLPSQALDNPRLVTPSTPFAKTHGLGSELPPSTVKHCQTHPDAEHVFCRDPSRSAASGTWWEERDGCQGGLSLPGTCRAPTSSPVLRIPALGRVGGPLGGSSQRSSDHITRDAQQKRPLGARWCAGRRLRRTAPCHPSWIAVSEAMLSLIQPPLSRHGIKTIRDRLGGLGSDSYCPC